MSRILLVPAVLLLAAAPGLHAWMSGPLADEPRPYPTSVDTASDAGPATGGEDVDGPVSLSGAPTMPGEVRSAILQRLEELPPGYEPRTRHLDGEGRALYTNRLILESSPYLLQHAHNPVDWRPWGEEAFAEARRLGRPLLLSVGYSTCHWCHVMERESFEDLEIARALNELYVPIKVDREERPDVDAAYMTAVQLLTRQGGGWPMTVWLTPEGEPFFGATYMPARDGDRGVPVGFLTQLLRARRVWDESRAAVEQSGQEIAELVRRTLTAEDLAGPATDAGASGPELTDGVVLEVRRRYDSRFGGLRPAPKFPGGLSIRLLLRHWLRSGDERSLEMASETLEGMAGGGLRDQIGGGFHRYAVDARWRVPHFEKMLYDNALLAIAYLEAYRATGKPDLADETRSILAYLDREMSSPEGAFFSATDADSPGPDGEPEEGLFFTWTRAEVDAVLDPDSAEVVAAAFGLDDEAELDGRHVLYRARSIGQVAQRLERTQEEVGTALETARRQLHDARSRRPPPLLDDKVLTEWNGLAISAFARAGAALAEPELVARAGTAADFLLDRLRDETGLYRVWRAGTASQPGFLEDHAFLEAALLDLYEATADPRWLREALALQADLDKGFAAPDGGYFRTSDDAEVVLARDRPFFDTALPSGNAVALQNLLRLHELTTDDRYRQRADELTRGARPFLERSAGVAAELLVGLEYAAARPREIVLVAATSRDEIEPFLAVLRERWEPHKVVVAGTEAELEASAEMVPFLEGKVVQEGRPTAYVCQQGVCRLPTTDPQVFVEQLEAARTRGSLD